MSSDTFLHPPEKTARTVCHDGFFLGSGSGMEGSQVLVESRRVSVSVSVSVFASVFIFVSVAVSKFESSESMSESGSRLKSLSEVATTSLMETLNGGLVGSVMPAALSASICGSGRKKGTTVLQPGVGSLVRVDAVGGDFNFGNTAEGEQELYEVLGRLFRSLFHNVGDRVGDRGLEHDAFGLEAGKVHTHELTGLEHGSLAKILPPRVVKCKPFPALVCHPQIHPSSCVLVTSRG